MNITHAYAVWARVLDLRKKAEYFRGQPDKQDEYKKLCRMLQPVVNGFFNVYCDDAMPIIKDVATNKDKFKSMKKRFYKRVLLMSECFEQLFFVTLTFNDNTLEKFKNNPKAVERTLSKVLCSSGAVDYCGCIDFGKKNERPHYHFIVASEKEFTNDCLSCWAKHWGFVNCKKITKGDEKKSASYAAKMVSYCSKGYPKGVRLISKRGVVHMKEYDTLPF